MKTAIYIEDGIVQLVITPETEFEQNALSSFKDKPLDVKIFSGSFYDCRGGWTKQEKYIDLSTAPYRTEDLNAKSIILRIEKS